MNSIFGIGVLEFVFILIFALIFLGPERLPKVTKDVLFFIRRIQKLSGDLTRQVNEEIGDLRELDPSYHMKQLMEDEEEDEEEKGKSIGQGASQTSSTSTKQTSAPSQPAQAAEAAMAEASEEKTIQEATAAPALSDLNAAASANGSKQGGESSGTGTRTSGTAIPSAPRGGATKSSAGAASRSRVGTTQKRGVKTLSELRKQQRAKRQSKESGADSSYLEERNKRAQRRTEERRLAVSKQKEALGEDSGPNVNEAVSTESSTIEETSSPETAVGDAAGLKEAVNSAAIPTGGDSADGDNGAEEAVTEEVDGEGTEETQL